MSNLFKKVVSSVAALSIVLSVVSPIAGVNAAYASSLEAANKLASLQVIKDSSANPADYRLGDNVTRREVTKIAVQLASCQGVTLNDTYAGKFSDVPASDWAWKYAETALDNGFVSANAMFNPSRNVSKGEALKLIMNATKVEKMGSSANFWADYVAGAVDAGVTESFSDYDTSAKRGWIVLAAANALDAGMCSEDTTDDSTLDDLLDGLDDTDGTTDDTTDTTDDTTTTTDGTFTVALSPDTPEAASIPGGVSGLPVAAFDFTAGDSDVTVTSITVKRKGISDKATLTSLAAFSSEGRASKGKDDTQNDATEALLTLTNGFVVKAGETRTLTIVADVESNFNYNVEGDEFAIELVEVVASATAQSDGSLVGNTFKVGSRDAAKIYVQTNGSVSNPKLGDEGVDVFKFAVKGASDEDVVVKSITFRADNSNAEDNLENFKVYLGSTEVASAAMMNDKYVTFTFGNGLTIAKNKTEKFNVKADVVAGAGDVIKFYVDKALDVSANGTKYGYGASVDITATNNDGIPANDNLGTLTIQAGELTLVDIDAPSDKIREDKDDVVLGTVKVTNVAGKNLELQEFGVKAILTGTAFQDADDDNFLDWGEAALTLATMLENVELYNVDTGASYELDLSGNVYSENDLGITLAQGTTTFQIRADVMDKIGLFNNAKLDLSLATGSIGVNGGFKVVETDDDTVVTDITPSSLSWKQLSGLESGATVSVSPLSNITKVRGASDVVALQFEVEADEASAVNIDEVKTRINAGLNLASSLQIAQVALYKGTVADANLLDRVSGSNLASGVATFDGFDVAIAADAKQTFVVTVSFVDGVDTTFNGTVTAANPTGINNNPYKATLTSISAEDDDNDDVNIAGLPISSARNVTVGESGQLTIVSDNNNTDNKEAKTILAGTSKTVFSADVQATNESVDVETAVFTVDQDLTKAVVSAALYLGDTLIATNSNSDITATTITFKNLTTLIVPQETKELRLALNTAKIGFEEVGETKTAVNVTNVALNTVEGVDSGKTVTNATLAVTSKDFAIVPVIVTPSVVSTLAGGQAKLKITVDAGANKVATSNNRPNALITNFVFSGLGSNTDGYDIYKEGESARKGTISSAGVFAAGTMTTADLTISSDTTYVIVPKGTVDKTYTLNLTKDGIVYSAVDSSNVALAGATGLTSNLSAELDLGTKTY